MESDIFLSSAQLKPSNLDIGETNNHENNLSKRWVEIRDTGSTQSYQISSVRQDGTQSEEFSFQ